MNTNKNVNENDFENDLFQKAEEIFNQKIPDFNQTLNIAIIGKVSSGKTSLINSLLGRSRENMIDGTEVSAESGTTKCLGIIHLDDHVLLIDSPGLGDVVKINSNVTEKFLKHIDIGILVVHGSADIDQKKYFDDLKKRNDNIFVVLSKADTIQPWNKETIIEQWKEYLDFQGKIYPVVTIGYDKECPPDYPLDIRGVDELREDISIFLKRKGKDILMARHMQNKTPAAVKIIIPAVVATAGQAWVPGSAAWITGTQATAIASLYYLYTGRILDFRSAMAIMPTFLGKTLGQNAFLWVEAFLPTTVVLDIAASAIAATITLAMLVTVTVVLSKEGDLKNKKLLGMEFEFIVKQAELLVKHIDLEDIGNREQWGEIIYKLINQLIKNYP